ERLFEAPALLVAPGTIGPRLVRIETLTEHPQGARTPTHIGAVVVEHALATQSIIPGQPDTFVVSTSLVPARISTRIDGAPLGRAPFAFTVPGRGGAFSVEAEVPPADLAAARARARRGTWSAAIAIFGATLLLCTGPIVELRRRTTDTRVFLART